MGILAHVDAGKTTLSEGLLYRAGAIRTLGRVDHRDAFLDTDELERERGITIFAHQAQFTLGGREFTLLDTPGHADFSAETERVLGVLDCAVLVISGADGVQGHTRTLWRLLKRYEVPTFLFVNKMDQPGADREALLEQLRKLLDGGCVDFTAPTAERNEALALCDEGALERYLTEGALPEETVSALIARRRAFPCYFGSALKLEGVDALMDGLARYAPSAGDRGAFAARVFRVTRAGGARLTWLKVTGGVLRVKDALSGGEGEDRWEEKADQLRIYSGEKFRAVDEAPAGTVCAVTGLTRTRPGQGLGAEEDGAEPVLEPVLTYQLLLPPDCDPVAALPKLRQLEEEDPQLRILWREQVREIHVQLMGQVQLEILKRRIARRFGWEVDFGRGAIVYRETIAAPAIGIGHYEPLRHYAEVHLLLEPLPRGSGFQAASRCSADQLDGNWQRLVLTHLLERRHPGVLTGAPVTDVRATLIAGRAHQKHTEGGDFRQATYRAVRQGLMGAENILLEPWYDLELELPAEHLGRALADIQRMGGEADAPEHRGDAVLLTAAAPVSAFGDYQTQVAAYTRGQGRLTCLPGGYRPCQRQEEVVAAIGYDPLRDLENPVGSVFCQHGAGVAVPWDQVGEMAHVDSGVTLDSGEEKPQENAPRTPGRVSYAGTLAEDKELQAIFERTYGKTAPRAFQPQKKPARTQLSDHYDIREQETGPEYLLVDGYNIIFAWDELKELARADVAAARQALMDILSNYQGFRKCRVILVFDAYKVKGNPGSVERYHELYVVYTREAETADNYIEKATLDLGRHHQVRVATSDYLEQLIILGHGALRVSARAFREEVEQTQGQIARLIAQNNRRGEKDHTVENLAVIRRREAPPEGKNQR